MAKAILELSSLASHVSFSFMGCNPSLPSEGMIQNNHLAMGLCLYIATAETVGTLLICRIEN